MADKPIIEDVPMLKADGLDDAIIGVGTRCGQNDILVYDYEKCCQIFSFLLYIFSLILELFKLLMGYIKELVNKTNVILQNFMSLIQYILDTFEIIKITIVFLLEFLKCGFFLLATSFSAVFVLPSITSFITLSVIAGITMLLAIIFSWFPPVGVPLAGNAVVTRVFALLMGIIMIFCIVLHKSLSRQTKRAFKTSSLFNSSC